MDGPRYEDDIETKSCAYVRSNSELIWGNTTYGDKVAFEDVMMLKDYLIDKYAVIMGLDASQQEETTFKDAYHYADLVFS